MKRIELSGTQVGRVARRKRKWTQGEIFQNKTNKEKDVF